MAPTYKLTYFNISGLGEPIRYMLSYGKIEFEDNRIEMQDWPKVKPNTVFGKLPFLEVDGKIIHQSAAICRYLGKQIGISGKTDWDALQADIAVDTLGDYRQYAGSYFREHDETKKAAILEEVKTVHTPFYMTKFDKQVAENGGYFVNNQLTWADIYFSAFALLLTNVLGDDLFDNYPNLKQLKEKVENLPGIKEYIANRPKSDR